MEKRKGKTKDGKVLIFRWTRRCPKTGKIIRAIGRPFPIWVDAEH